jgi:aminopeptidase N
MPLGASNSANGMTTYQFDDTPSIPSYILAFAIGAFAPVEQGNFASTLILENYLQQLQINVQI